MENQELQHAAQDAVTHPFGARLSEEQKRQIGFLRYEGKSYPQIAEITGICKNTIQTYCYRNHLGGNITRNPGKFKLCKNCGKVTAQWRGGEKLFCSATCRLEWWKYNRDRSKENCNYTLICEHCHKEFKSYGNKHQRFCSRGCFAAYRRERQEVPEDDKRPDELRDPLPGGAGSGQADALPGDHQPAGL